MGDLEWKTMERDMGCARDRLEKIVKGARSLIHETADVIFNKMKKADRKSEYYQICNEIVGNCKKEGIENYFYDYSKNYLEYEDTPDGIMPCGYHYDFYGPLSGIDKLGEISEKSTVSGMKSTAIAMRVFLESYYLKTDYAQYNELNMYLYFIEEGLVSVKSIDTESEVLGLFQMKREIKNKARVLYDELLALEMMLDRQRFSEWSLSTRDIIMKVRAELKGRIIKMMMEEIDRLAEEEDKIKNDANLGDEEKNRLICAYYEKINVIKEHVLRDFYDETISDARREMDKHIKVIQDAAGVDDLFTGIHIGTKEIIMHEIENSITIYKLLEGEEKYGKKSSPNYTAAIILLTKTLEILLYDEVYSKIDTGKLESGLVPGNNNKYLDNHMLKARDIMDLGKLENLFSKDDTTVSWKDWWNNDGNGGEKIVRISELKKFKNISLPGNDSFGDDDDENREKLLSLIDNIRKNYRNPAAHKGRFSRQEYEECRNLMVTGELILWILIAIIK